MYSLPPTICSVRHSISLFLLGKHIQYNDVLFVRLGGRMSEKLFKFVNASAERAFMELPLDIKKQFGSDLNAVQQGARPYSASKDISSSVGVGAIELIENGSPAFRVVYCAKYLNTIYILHAFTKTTNGVDKAAMATAKLRYKEMMTEVAGFEKEKKMRVKRKKAK